MPSHHSVAVIGAGAWGTALASVAARAGRDVVLYARNAEAAARMNATRTNLRLPGVSLDARILAIRPAAVRNEMQLAVAEGEPRTGEPKRGTLDLLQPEQDAVEALRPLEVADGQRDVVERLDVERHGYSY